MAIVHRKRSGGGTSPSNAPVPNPLRERGEHERDVAALKAIDEPIQSTRRHEHFAHDELHRRRAPSSLTAPMRAVEAADALLDRHVGRERAASRSASSLA